MVPPSAPPLGASAAEDRIAKFRVLPRSSAWCVAPAADDADSLARHLSVQQRYRLHNPSAESAAQTTAETMLREKKAAGQVPLPPPRRGGQKRSRAGAGAMVYTDASALSIYAAILETASDAAVSGFVRFVVMHALRCGLLQKQDVFAATAARRAERWLDVLPAERVLCDETLQAAVLICASRYFA